MEWIERQFPIYLWPGLYLKSWYWAYDAHGNTVTAFGIRVVCNWFGGG